MEDVEEWEEEGGGGWRKKRGGRNGVDFVSDNYDIQELSMLFFQDCNLKIEAFAKQEFSKLLYALFSRVHLNLFLGRIGGWFREWYLW